MASREYIEKNTGLIHNTCAYKRRREFQELNPNLSLKTAGWVKIGFPVIDVKLEDIPKNGEINHDDDVHREWMWVRVTDFDDEKKEFKGYLDSDPILVTYISEGMSVESSYDEICEAIEQKKDVKSEN